MSQSTPPSRTGRLTLLLVSAALVATTAVTAARVARAWPREAHLGYAEGIWLALAIDTAHGTFYRPMEGPLGYGGTRYFPLFFTLTAGLIRAGLPPVAAGYATAGASVAALLAAIWITLRRLEVPPALSALGVAAALACQPVQMALLTIRGDALPAALALFGLAACLVPDGRRARGAVMAAVWFTLAFAAKPTSLYAAAAGAAALAFCGHPRRAARVGLATLGGLLLTAAAIVWASGGRQPGIFMASASGGTDLASLVAAPVSLAHMLRRAPESAVFIAGAVWATARVGRHVLLYAAAFIACAAATLAIYASPATVENHLIDLAVLAVILTTVYAARLSVAARERVTGLIAIAALFGCALAGARFRTEDREDLRAPRQAAMRDVAQAPDPVLVKQPMLAAEAGRQTYVLDPYVLSVRITRNPAVLDKMLDDLRAHRFGAVVLEHTSPALLSADSFEQNGQQRFMETLARTYDPVEAVSGRQIYRPRP